MRSQIILVIASLALIGSACAQVHPNLQNAGACTWQIYLDTAGSGTATATPQTFGNASPSISGSSMLLSLSGNKFTNVGWYCNTGIFDTLTYQSLDFYFYTSSLAKTQALEFDQGQYLLTSSGQVSRNTRLFYGTQCIVGGHWDIWNSYTANVALSGGNWVDTGVPCSVSTSAFHHLVIQVHRVTNDTSGPHGYPKMHYDAITLDGVAIIANQTTEAGPLPTGWTEQSVFMLQMDTNGACGSSCTITETFDQLTASLSASAPVCKGVTFTGGITSTGGRTIPCM